MRDWPPWLCAPAIHQLLPCAGRGYLWCLRMCRTGRLSHTCQLFTLHFINTATPNQPLRTSHSKPTLRPRPLRTTHSELVTQIRPHISSHSEPDTQTSTTQNQQLRTNLSEPTVKPQPLKPLDTRTSHLEPATQNEPLSTIATFSATSYKSTMVCLFASNKGE